MAADSIAGARAQRRGGGGAVVRRRPERVRGDRGGAGGAGGPPGVAASPTHGPRRSSSTSAAAASSSPSAHDRPAEAPKPAGPTRSPHRRSSAASTSASCASPSASSQRPARRRPVARRARLRARRRWPRRCPAMRCAPRWGRGSAWPAPSRRWSPTSWRCAPTTAPLVHGHVLTLADIDAAQVAFRGMTSAARGRLAGIQPGREDVILAGALLAREVCRAVRPRRRAGERVRPARRRRALARNSRRTAYPQAERLVARGSRRSRGRRRILSPAGAGVAER